MYIFPPRIVHILKDPFHYFQDHMICAQYMNVMMVPVSAHIALFVMENRIVLTTQTREAVIPQYSTPVTVLALHCVVPVLSISIGL